MIHLRQHVPSWVDTRDAAGIDRRNEWHVETVEELLAIPWVAQWKTECHDAQFCVDVTTLMIDGTRQGRRWWWVIGFVDGLEDGALPTWQRPSIE